MGNFLGSVPYLDKNSENEQRNYVISRSNMSKKLLENLSFNIFWEYSEFFYPFLEILHHNSMDDFWLFWACVRP